MSIPDTSWQDDAQCLVTRAPMPWFFPEAAAARRTNSGVRKALELCAECPVKKECLEYALKTRTTEGIFGGTLPAERADMYPDPVEEDQ